MHKRKERVAHLIRSEVSEMILKELKDPRIGFVSVTGVEALQPHRIKAVNMTRKMAKNFKRGYGISISFNSIRCLFGDHEQPGFLGNARL